MAMKMRQSMSQFEQAFHEETHADHVRREALRKQAMLRTRQRSIERRRSHGRWRFLLLVLVLIGTAVGVTLAMFQVLFLVMS